MASGCKYGGSGTKYPGEQRTMQDFFAERKAQPSWEVPRPARGRPRHHDAPHVQ